MALVIVVFLLCLLSVPFTWVRSWNAVVNRDGALISSARVYRNVSGDFLIDLRMTTHYFYLVQTSRKDIGIPNDSFPLKTSVIWFTTEHPVKIVPLISAKAGPIDSAFSVTPQAIRFNLGDKDTIEVLMH